MSPLRPRGARSLAALVFLALASSCGDGTVAPDPLDDVATVALAADSLRLPIGTPVRVRAEVRNGRSELVEASVAWSTSDPDVATVDTAGRVTAIAPGAVQVTARVEGVTGALDLDAFDPDPPIAPGEVTATVVSNREVVLTWLDQSNSETSVVVRREVLGSGAPAAVGSGASPVEVGTLDANVTRFVDTGLEAATVYQYTVESCNPIGCSPAQAAGQVTTFADLELEAPTALPDGVVGTDFDFQFVASGPVTSWLVVDGDLPPGLSLGVGGRVEGRPLSAGPYAFTVGVVGGGQQVEATVEQDVWVAPQVGTMTLPTGVVGASYAAGLESTGGDGSFLWRVIEGVLPPGLTLSANGTVSGTPASAGTYPLVVEVETVGLRATAALTVRIFDPLVVSTTSLTPAVIDTPYASSLVATGGDGSYNWTLIGGVLPPGIDLASNGAIAGTPSLLGESSWVVEVQSGDGQVATGTLALAVNEQILPPVVTTVSFPDGGVGAPWSETAQATEGNGVFQWAVVSGSLPSGLVLQSSTGRISGTPTAAGSFPFRLRVSSAGLSGTRDLNVTIRPALGITSTNLPTGVVGAAYSSALTTSGGDGSPAFAVVAGALPTGLGLDTGSGVISGTPQVAGTAGVTVRATNALGQQAERALTITSFLPVSVTTASLADGSVSTPYSQTLAASGGDGSYTWAVVSGTLPAGLGLSGGGALTGTPTVAGSSSFTVRVTSGDGQTASAALSVVVSAPPPQVTTTGLPTGLVGSAYSVTLAASGGDGSYAWAITSGSLPAGLALDAGSGLLDGTPTESGVFNLTFEVTSAGSSASRALAVIVSSAPVDLQRSYLPGGYLGVPYSAAPAAATGGSGSYTYTVTSGALPPGLAVDPSTGAISGVPSGAGMAFFELTASSAGSSASVVYGLTISTAAPGGLNVFGLNVADVIPSSTTRGAIDAALARYEQVLTGDAPDYIMPSSGLDGACGGSGGLLHGQTIDDIVVIMDIGPIDGPGGIAGQAGLCGVIRSSGPFAVAAQLILDSQDLDGFDPAVQFALVWHEIGHGFGLLEGAWVQLGLMTGENGPAPEYIGAQGVSAFQGILGGTGNPPIEADGGSGTRDSHWDEGFFNSEMMTGFLDPVGNSLSALTIGALGDLGWPGPNLGAADAYSIPGCSPACSVPAPAPGVGDTRIPLLDDVIREDVWVRGPDGVLRRVSLTSPGG